MSDHETTTATPVVAVPVDPEPVPVTANNVAAEKERRLNGPTAGPDRSVEQLVKKYLSVFSESKVCPPQIRPTVVQLTPVLAKVAQQVADMIPFCVSLYNKLMEFYDSLRPYRPELLIPSFAGFIMCFFGGSFLTVIAAVEAFKMVGYAQTAVHVNIIVEDVKKVIDANVQDDAKDENNDGVADVLQISNGELVKRKLLLCLRAVDPARIGSAVAALNAGFLAILATLKLQFAKTITLGNSIAEMIEAPVDRYVIPHVEPFVPAEYRKWIQPTVSYSIRSASISVAWFLQRILSAIHSALRGGLMFSRNILVYLKAMKIYDLDHEKTYLDEIVGYGLAALGLFFQLSTGFSLPFPLNILLFPFSICEYVLIWFVTRP